MTQDTLRAALLQIVDRPMADGVSTLKGCIDKLRDIRALAAAPQAAPSVQVAATPDAGHPLLQRLIDSIEVVEGVGACWDYAFMYDVRDALASSPQASPPQPEAPPRVSQSMVDQLKETAAVLDAIDKRTHERAERLGLDASPPEAAAVPLPHPGSPEASAMIDSLLAEYGHPSNTKNAARAGFEAARRWLAAPPNQAQGEPT